MRYRIFKAFAAAVVAVTLAVTALCGCGGRGETPDLAPHLIATPEASPVRPIDAKDGVALSDLDDELSSEQYRERVNELYATVVFDGKRPIFSDGDPVKPIYDAARAMLDRYVLNAWCASADGRYRTVHAIHDWLVCSVGYDFDLYDRFMRGETDSANDPAFHIDGVFLNGRAVCDGLSRAFNFLCAIENIESVRVTGSYSSVPHAWNKVKLGGKWYNADVTSDAAYYTVGNGAYKKQLSHGFFLLSDDTIAEFENGHVFTEPAYPANEDYDYYSAQEIRVGGKKFSAVVKSQAELNRLFESVADSDGAVGKLEVKLDFPNKTQVNFVDMYVDEIAAAYGKADDADFVFSIDNKPYFRYPNGVYVFLIYK